MFSSAASPQKRSKAQSCSLVKKMPRALVSSLLKLILGGFGLEQREGLFQGIAVHQVAKGKEQQQSAPCSPRQGEPGFGVGFCGCEHREGGCVTACSCGARERRKGSHLFKRRGCETIVRAGLWNGSCLIRELAERTCLLWDSRSSVAENKIKEPSALPVPAEDDCSVQSMRKASPAHHLPPARAYLPPGQAVLAMRGLLLLGMALWPQTWFWCQWVMCFKRDFWRDWIFPGCSEV